MSKNKNKRKRKGTGYKPPAGGQDQEATIAELEALRPSLEDPAAGPSWGAAHKLLLKTSIDSARVGSAIIGRDVDAFDQLIRELRGTATPEDTEAEETPEAEAIDPEVLRKAMKAFRRRMKLIRLDQESKLGVGPMTGGHKADFESIIAPHEFPDAVWKALAAAGRLVATGKGFYKLPSE